MKNRRGMLVLEIAVAALLVGLLLVISVKTMGWSVRERRSVDWRTAALVEVGNLLDEITRMPWDELTEEKLKDIELSEEAKSILPNGELTILLGDSDTEPSEKQITVSIDWLGSYGEREGPIRLSAWKFRSGAKQ